MANYKPFTAQTITVAGIKTYVPPNAKIIHLYDNTNLSAIADSIFNSQTGLVYTVPNNTTFHMVSLRIHVILNATITIFSADDENGTDTLKLTTPLLSSLPHTVEFYVQDVTFTNVEEYITVVASTAQCEWIEIIGYEVPD